MYHRIATPPSDVWEISVSADNFEKQLIFLKKNYQVLTLDALVKQLKTSSLIKNAVAITFDDGCLDNFNTAKPLLEKHQLPATFFIPSGFVDGKKSFWWDDLENIFLSAPELPAYLSININGIDLNFNLQNEEALNEDLVKQHKNWDPDNEPPPTKRAYCYFSIWQQLKPLTSLTIDTIVSEIVSWANYKPYDATGICMSFNQAIELDSHSLFNIECHSVHHPALAFHDKVFQSEELLSDKSFWEINLKRKVTYLAYPYGNYNDETQQVARELKFEAAFTTECKFVHYKSNLFTLPRFQVKNWDEKSFEQNLKKLME